MFQAGFYSYEILTLCHCLLPNNNKCDHCDIADAALYIRGISYLYCFMVFILVQYTLQFRYGYITVRSLRSPLMWCFFVILIRSIWPISLIWSDCETVLHLLVGGAYLKLGAPKRKHGASDIGILWARFWSLANFTINFFYFCKYCSMIDQVFI